MRRHDLDWLRVLVFALLIFYHVGMFFVPWGWHIKNNVIYPDARWPMLFVNQWRLPILFVISGMGTYIALGKRSGGQFAWERIKRLLIPLAIGMALIIPPQVYFERLARGQFSGSYLDFWPSYAFLGVYPEGNLSWHHLWFLPYLLLFSLISIPLLLFVRSHPQSIIVRAMRRLASTPYGLFGLVIPLYLWESFLEPFFPSTHALIGDWFNLVNYLTFFLYGFLLISVKEAFWKTTIQHRRNLLYVGVIMFGMMVALRQLFADSTLVHFIEAAFKVINLWAWILVLFGYAATYLNRKSESLSYANEAVYPFYILHQTITIAIGYYLMDSPAGFWSKFAMMSIGTFGMAWLIYEFGIRRWSPIRPLFGLKPHNGNAPA
ncbi:MAG: acyltransferase family protein [Lunatimonas sp.]|uniref:acyltransferase family protein n=1 Tax=Lunatimonas sp. TaxID=2060141 RepID=UPI00263AED79|nr:acyltransferase family protein [Lunatimonas sp.]MCC5937592.1 acyltransferase family protein [Lunatimonas sp.]